MLLSTIVECSKYHLFIDKTKVHYSDEKCHIFSFPRYSDALVTWSMLLDRGSKYSENQVQAPGRLDYPIERTCLLSIFSVCPIAVCDVVYYFPLILSIYNVVTLFSDFDAGTFGR